MSIFSKLFGGHSTEPESAPDHAVIVSFQYGSTDLTRIFQLEKLLEDAIEENGAGTYDGNEIAVDGSDGSLYMYGPDAGRLFDVVRPILEAVSFMQGAKVLLRYGPPKEGVKEKTVILAS